MTEEKDLTTITAVFYNDWVGVKGLFCGHSLAFSMLLHQPREIYEALSQKWKSTEWLFYPLFPDRRFTDRTATFSNFNQFPLLVAIVVETNVYLSIYHFFFCCCTNNCYVQDITQYTFHAVITHLQHTAWFSLNFFIVFIASRQYNA